MYVNANFSESYSVLKSGQHEDASHITASGLKEVGATSAQDSRLLTAVRM